jgi:regulator of protease activity HflC (stomatin/prohibitin superfamily)
VPVNREYAQQFFGSYTGESFPAGFCLLPRLPFPLVSILIKIFASEKANTYLGWTLEGSVSIASITTELFVSGMTKDKIRVSISGRFVFEISAPHTYLSQTDGGKDVHSLKEAIEAEASARMKKSVLGAYTLTELQQGEDSLRYQEIAEAISAQCDLSYEFGVKLVRTPILHIEILSKQVQTIHDRVNAQDLFALALAHSQKLFTAFAEEYRKQFPEADSAEIQAAFASALAQEPTANLNVLKIKK